MEIWYGFTSAPVPPAARFSPSSSTLTSSVDTSCDMAAAAWVMTTIFSFGVRDGGLASASRAAISRLQCSTVGILNSLTMSKARAMFSSARFNTLLQHSATARCGWPSLRCASMVSFIASSSETAQSTAPWIKAVAVWVTASVNRSALSTPKMATRLPSSSQRASMGPSSSKAFRVASSHTHVSFDGVRSIRSKSVPPDSVTATEWTDGHGMWPCQSMMWPAARSPVKATEYWPEW
mmetsp:Transcript_11847/g.31091  ORF Transcript_11847/g.31091 Transcript_11847/m.31091 type:complete len:236 (-) Transcript_11847:143-850(-)